MVEAIVRVPVGRLDAPVVGVCVPAVARVPTNFISSNRVPGLSGPLLVRLL